MDEDLEAFTVSLHGEDVRYVRAGSGPVVVLIHGILGSRLSWARLVSLLERDFTVIAPDLFGGGDSARSGRDYTLGGHAGRLRDLLDALGIERATLVGHSLGGGVAMQFAWLFPDRCERLVLISSGGLGRELGLILRAPTLPGAGWVLPLISMPWLHRGGERLAGQLGRFGWRSGADVEELWRGYVSLGDAEVRRAFRGARRRGAAGDSRQPAGGVRAGRARPTSPGPAPLCGAAPGIRRFHSGTAAAGAGGLAAAVPGRPRARRRSLAHRGSRQASPRSQRP